MWSKDELLVLRILPNPEFIDAAIEEVTYFSSMEFCPNYWENGTPRHHFTCTQTPSCSHVDEANTESDDLCQNSSTSSDKWCYCGGPEEEQMIWCDNQKCPILWYHTDCLRVVHVPTGKWFYPDCRKLNKKAKR